MGDVMLYSAAIKAGKMPGAILDPLPKIQRQEGPNCGFYALSIVMHYWKEAGKVDSALPARKRDVAAGGDGGQPVSLRALGKQAGALDMEGVPRASAGGVFTAEQLAAVAKAANFDVKVITRHEPDQFIAMLSTLIDIGVPPIVAFDVQKGDPVMAGGEHSHWGVIVGYCKVGATQWLIATHGHGKYYKWIAGDLQKSNFNLCGTKRKIGDEVKVRLELKENAVNSTVAPLTRYGWTDAKALAKMKQLAANPKSDVQEVILKSRVIKKGMEVKQDLGCHIIGVYPKKK